MIDLSLRDICSKYSWTMVQAERYKLGYRAASNQESKKHGLANSDPYWLAGWHDWHIDNKSNITD